MTQHDQPGGANLPAVPDGEVVDGVVVGEPEEQQNTYVLNVLNVVVKFKPEHARAVVRHGSYVPAGLVVAWRRHRRRRTLAADMAHHAHLAGDRENALKLVQHAELERHQRHQRVRERIELAVTLVKLSPWFLGIWVFLMVATGLLLAWAHHSPGYLLWPWKVLADTVSTLAAVAAWGWLAVVVIVPLAGLAVLHRLGRDAGDLAPGWARTSAGGDVDPVIDEKAVTQALKQLRIPQISDYLKAGTPLAYLVPCRQEGRGTYCEVRLPNGLPALEIAKQTRRAGLAAGLYRQTKEVWPTTGADNSILKLWVADKGALADGAGPYPLLEDGTTDVFRGVPFGKTLKGDPVTAPLMERNTITGGMPGQGKSSAARVIMCGAALDPTAELWIMIPDVNFDFEVMKRRCSRYVMGAEDEHVEAIRDWLADLKDEVQRRGQLLVDYEVPAVTRKLASARVGLHPLFVLLEEAHVAIQHSVFGKEIAALLTDVVKLGRKRGIHVIVSTQAPTKDSMPRDVTRNCTNGIAFAVGDHVPNDALLGAGAYRAGHRATELIPGTDRGVAVVKGFSGERSEMCQVYFLSVDEPDQVTPIIDRALAEAAKRGGLAGRPAPELAIEVRDLLDDLAEVITGPDRVKVNDLPVQLRKLAPRWGAYKNLTGRQLRELVAGEGVRVYSTDNRPELDPADLERARRDRNRD